MKELLNEIPFIKKGRNEFIANIPCAFDIEASSFYQDGEKKATMYAWAFGINGECIRGRTWDEFVNDMNIISAYYKLHSKKRLIVYVHNLAYEFQWFQHYFEWEKVFALDNRKPVYAITTIGIEFRCSYLLSGYSLAVLADNLTKYKVSKLVGDLDYQLIRHSKTPLTEKEWRYILNDVLVVMAHIQEEIERLGSITKLPLTKTGYVRELCRNNCLKNGSNRWNYASMIHSLTLTPEQYAILKRGYMGGFTHANILYVDRIMSNVHSFDFTSSYPAVMVSEKFPMSKPFRYKPKDAKDFIEHLRAFCCVFDVEFVNIRASVQYENYISFSKCQYIQGQLLNNGRVIEAEKLTITLTEQDFFIIKDLYVWDSMNISKFYYMYKDYLPKEMVLTILELYKNKTELKDVPEKIVEYLVSKGMINAVYGMCVTDVCRDEYTYSGCWSVEKADVNAQIDKYNNDRNRFLYYAWGVWVTAYARRNLFSGIIEFKTDYIYSDTDSIKVINIENHTEYIENYNKTVTEKIYKCLDRYGIDRSYSTPKTIKGIEKPLGVWDYEGMYSKFKTLGAKRYMIEKNGKIEITIAGVNKKAGIKYLKHIYKTNDAIFEAFKEDMVFPAEYDKDGIIENGSGKLCHTYIDYEINGEIADYLGNVEEYREYSAVHMENTEYTLGIDATLIKLILGIKEGHII